MEPTKNDCLNILKTFGKEGKQLSEAELSILGDKVVVWDWNIRDYSVTTE